MNDYFALLQLPRRFDVDNAALEARYFEAQKRFHPDRLIGKSASEREHSIRQSMLFNEAYGALKTPLTRARHLLALQGISVGGEQDSVKPDAEILMDVLQQREALSDMADIASLDAIASANAKACTDIVARLSTLFDAENYKTAAQETMRLGYLLKLEHDIRIKRKTL